MILERLRYVLLVPALLLCLAPLSAWGQKQSQPQKAPADQTEVVKRLKAENASLKQRVMMLMEQNNMMTENLMNCMQDLQERESGASEQQQDQPKEAQ